MPRTLCLPLISLLLAIVSLGAQGTPPKSPGNLGVIPHRVVIQGRDRAAEIMLRNEDSAPAVYRILLKEMDMTPDGGLVDRPHREGEITGADLVRMTPRQVELKPGETQMVRFQLRKPENLPDGEYRSHVHFQAVPPPKPPVAPGEGDEKTMNFDITPIFGITIPLIIRHGHVVTDIKLGQMKLVPPKEPGKPPFLSVDLLRSGNGSVLGDFQVTVEKSAKLSRGTVLAIAKGVGIYNGLDHRTHLMSLEHAAKGELAGAKLKVVFTPTDGSKVSQTAFFDVGE
jgi:P pilus assembly chaperone PapD